MESGLRPLFGIYGASGCGRGTLPIADQMLAARHGPSGFELVFVDDAPQSPTANGRRVLTYGEFCAASCASHAICIAIADGRIRERLAQRCAGDGIPSFSVRAPNVVMLDDVELAEGAILAPFVTITSNVRIGRHFHANLYSYVEHDCFIGDFVTFAPGVQCNGNIRIEDHAYLGAGCMLRQGVPGSPLVIGAGAVVGMGAVVTHDVPARMVVAGNPARALTES